MARLYSFADEAKIIRALCDEKRRTVLLPLLTDEHFGMSWSRPTFSILKNRVGAVSWDELIQWSDIPSHARCALEEMDEPMLVSEDRMWESVERLRLMRNLRVLHSAVGAARFALAESDDKDAASVVLSVTETLRQALAQTQEGK